MVVSDEIKPVDLYCYLKAKFGDPNGFQMALRKSHTSDNLINWHWTLAYEDDRIEILGYLSNLRIGVRSQHRKSLENIKELLTVIKSDFINYADQKIAIKNSLENWIIFLNPHKRLKQFCDNLEEEILAAIKSSPPKPLRPQNNKQIRLYKKRSQNYADYYYMLSQKCLSLKLFTPIVGEALINLIILILAKKEIKDNSRLYKSTIHDQIDLRIQRLNLNCQHFIKPIDINDRRYKNFLTIMNSRNDFLHGNVDPLRWNFGEIYFDQHTIPIYEDNFDFMELATKNMLKFVEPDAVLQEYRHLEEFKDFILEHVTKEAREAVACIANTLEPGWRKDNKVVGILLPEHGIDFFSF